MNDPFIPTWDPELAEALLDLWTLPETTRGNATVIDVVFEPTNADPTLSVFYEPREGEDDATQAG